MHHLRLPDRSGDHPEEVRTYHHRQGQHDHRLQQESDHQAGREGGQGRQADLQVR